MNRLLCWSVASLLLALSAFAKEPRTVLIHLTDETQIRGQILEMVDGAYKVKTDTLGVLTVPADTIDRIDYNPQTQAVTTHQPNAAPALGQSDRLNALFGFEDVLQTVMANPDLMQEIQKLAEDPEFNAVLDDPEIKKAIEDGNFVSLAGNRKLWKLMDNPRVKKITAQVKNTPSPEDSESTVLRPSPTQEAAEKNLKAIGEE